MNAVYDSKVPTHFAEEARFELEPRLEEHKSEELFTELKAGLLDNVIEDTATLSLRKRFQQVAGEAAGIAWTTEFPMLVYPTLFEELASKARLSAARGEMIKARSATLLAGAV